MENDFGSSTKKLMVDCKICHDEDEISSMEIPCSCSGTLKYAHRRCVQRWCNEKGDTICEICLQPFKTGYIVPSPSLVSPLNGISVNFRRGQPNTGFLGMVSVDHLFMDRSDNIEGFSVQNARSLICCRLVAIISSILVLLRMTLPIIFSVADQSSAMKSLLVLINIVGMILFICIMVKVFTTMEHLQRQQTHEMRGTSYYGSNFNHI